MQKRSRPSVQEWEKIYDALYGQEPTAPFGSDYTGWVSAIDKAPIPRAEMDMWRTDTAGQIRQLGGSRIIEIGAGRGLLLSALASQSEIYWATDLSRVAISRLRANVLEAKLQEKVRLFQQPAHRIDGLPGTSSTW